MLTQGLFKMTDFEELRKAVETGHKNNVIAIIQVAIDAHEDVTALLNKGMIPGMREIGERFSKGEVYVPELLIAARAMQAGLSLIEPVLIGSERESRGKIAVGTVKGDLHDIGKNLVAVMLEGAGYEVIDLGVNCDIDKYKSALDQGAQILACSALLTTTMPYMREVVNALKDEVMIIVGGAPITQAYADEIGADGYSADANGAVKLVDKLLKYA